MSGRFIKKWGAAPLTERPLFHSFVIDLCSVLGVAAPNQESASDPDYQFEKLVRFDHGGGAVHWGFIDCYRRGCFVMEAKQTRKKLVAKPDRSAMKSGQSGAAERRMDSARAQAQGYARALDEWPPFLVLIDLSRRMIELWSDFGRMGKTYLQYPDRETFRIGFEDLADPAVRARLAAIWEDPMSLDPARQAIAATTQISSVVGRLVKALRARELSDDRHDLASRTAAEQKVALFVMQCLFAMFAESIGLIPDKAFSAFLNSYLGHADRLKRAIGDVFQAMDVGGWCGELRVDLPCFNGGIYKDRVALNLSEVDLEVLFHAARCDWARVEPSIFGSLMEQALSAKERGQLGAHYTPKPMVDLLVQATIMDVLEAEWEATSVQAARLNNDRKRNKAVALVSRFHRKLCRVVVLDPACGTANFLYVAMDRMKDLEGEVIQRLVGLGVSQRTFETTDLSVGPGQFLGIEKNLQAALIAVVVMWIGHLQWVYRVRGRAAVSNPVLRDYGAIRHRDAILNYDRHEAAAGTSDGVRSIAPFAPEWPAAHFIVGNPPFIAGKDMRRELGNAYVEALWASRGGKYPSADLVTVWWDRAAEILAADAGSPGPFTASDEVEDRPALQRFGFVTTNSITQPLSRRVVEARLGGDPPIHLTFAIPDHMWSKGAGAANVRVAMTVAKAGPPDRTGRLLKVVKEEGSIVTYSESRGDIGADLTMGVNLTEATALRANRLLAHRGVQLMGDGFLVTAQAAQAMARLSAEGEPAPVRLYRNGRDLTDRSRDLMAIDLYGWSLQDASRRHPGFVQHLVQAVKPGREANNRAAYRDNWWTFGEPRRELRAALSGLKRFIVTVETSKHRWFRFLDTDILPDNRLVCVASDSGFILGVLSSRVHRAWALAAGGRLEDRPVYSKGVCFDRFAFPAVTCRKEEIIAVEAEHLDALRARVLARNPELTMTVLYNVMDKAVHGHPLSEFEQMVRRQGCVDLLLESTQRLDRLVLEAYGWPSDLGDAAIVARLFALNLERAKEEGAGEVRFLRPGYQATRVKTSVNHRKDLLRPVTVEQSNYPEDGLDQIRSVLAILQNADGPMTAKQILSRFTTGSNTKTANKNLIATLGILTAAGSVYDTDTGWFTPRRYER